MATEDRFLPHVRTQNGQHDSRLPLNSAIARTHYRRHRCLVCMYCYQRARTAKSYSDCPQYYAGKFDKCLHFYQFFLPENLPQT
jgi:hypothetical protein